MDWENTMRIKSFSVVWACTAIMGACLAGNTMASAQGHDAGPATAAAMAPVFLVAADTPDLGSSVPTTRRNGIGSAVDSDSLERLRGGLGGVDNKVLIEGTVSGNTAEQTVSGSNSISDGAFANAAGINTVIQNTGNNVLIQNGMVVNIQFVAPVP